MKCITHIMEHTLYISEHIDKATFICVFLAKHCCDLTPFFRAMMLAELRPATLKLFLFLTYGDLDLFFFLQSGVLPLAVKLGQGCLACEVFKVLFFSADSQLMDLTAGRKLEIETMKLLDRPDPYWLSLREYYAATVIARACFRHMVRVC